MCTSGRIVANSSSCADRSRLNFWMAEMPGAVRHPAEYNSTSLPLPEPDAPNYLVMELIEGAPIAKATSGFWISALPSRPRARNRRPATPRAPWR